MTVLAELQKAFIEDHQQLTRGLYAVQRAIDRSDFAQATAVAEKLDRSAGPHIEFEERVFYPALEPILGKNVIRAFLREHEAGRTALLQLLSLKDETTVEAPDIASINAQLTTAREHALSCGSLLSHIDAFDSQEIERMLDSLYDIRRQGHRWTGLSQPTTA